MCATCVPHRRQLPLPDAAELPWTELKRLAAGSERVCALLASRLYCWDYAIDDGEFSAPTVEAEIVDFDLDNRVLCTVSRRGELRCVGSARARADLRAPNIELIPGASSRTINVSRSARHVTQVATHYVGACHVDTKERATCWRWDDDTDKALTTSSELRVLDLRTVADGVQLWTDAGVFEVGMNPGAAGIPLEVAPVEPELGDEQWVHGHAVACRELDGGEIECQATIELDSAEPSFAGWVGPPTCSGG